MAEHQITFRINAVIGINVEADSFEQAVALAKKKLNARNMPFNKGIEYIDGKNTIIGVTNNDEWRIDE